jgi:dynein heavy chain 2, cytosolic
LTLLSVMQIEPLLDLADSKNKLMRSVAGGGVEQMNGLKSRWSNFELMMESHQMMVKEQVNSCRVIRC